MSRDILVTHISDRDLDTVQRGTEEWNLLEHYLQVCCRSSRSLVQQIWHINVASAEAAFERRTKGRLVLYCWVDTNELDLNNSIQDVCRRSFKIPPSGMKFTSGNIKLPGIPSTINESSNCTEDLDASIELSNSPFLPNSHSDFTTTRRLFEYFLCKVGVGCSVVKNSEKEANGNHFQISSEYDTVFLRNRQINPPSIINSKIKSNNGNDLSAENELNLTRSLCLTTGVLPQHTFRHEYIIYESSQVVPQYLVQFEYDSSIPELFAVPWCDECQDAPAILWCQADTAKLCDSCDERLHRHNKLVSRHVRIPVNQMPRASGCCPVHTMDNLEEFCTLCNVPMCRLCRPAHAHTEESTSSLIMPIGRAYRAQLERHNKPHPCLNSRKIELLEKLESQQIIYNDVRTNMFDVEQRIYALLENSMRQLQIAIEAKINTVLCEQLIFNQLLQQLEWSEGFLQYLQSVLPPADFLFAWLRHCHYREEIFQLCDLFTDDNKFLPDLRLVGRVDILSESALRHNKNHKDAKHSLFLQ
ncbi:B-box zinc finger domain-containing protein [Cryptosporidium andersoni]|uniref:B-box zinc finger domain-containing protein n=1 Tax=Cryptosporidium andersoni TaxID=117008 RepID=A0A1J4MNX6_9CRYT|nr:B-box zinc finger domain-containing protein [Cryptosporidium andersoni]